MGKQSDRHAFTLIELLVCMAILGVLTGIMVPAVQRVRESAALAQCSNNLRQVGLGAHTYYHTFRKLPPAITMPYALKAAPPSITDASGIPPVEMLNDLLSPIIDSPARKNSDPSYPFGPNWAVHLLPYIDQGSLAAQARTGDYLVGYRNGNATLRDRWRNIVKDKAIPVYVCASDIGTNVPFAGYSKAPGPWARGNYAANAGPGWWQMSLAGGTYVEAYGKTGPMMGINFGAVPEKVPDGASNTVLFTEVRAGVNAKDPRGVWAMGFPGSSVTAANAIGDCPTPNDRNEGSDDVEGCPGFWYKGIGSRDRIGCSPGFANLGWPSWQAQARSRHPNGVNACFGDGSVRCVTPYIAQGVWFYMLSTSDGQVYHYDF